MNKHNSLRTNMIFSVAYQLFATAIPLITAPYISRTVGASGLGLYSYYYSIALYFVYFAMLGISNYANRAISKKLGDNEKINRIFSGIYYLQIITSLIALMAYGFYVLFIVDGDKTIPSIMLLYVASALFDVSWLYFGLQEFKTASIRQLIIKLLSFAAIFVFVKDQDDLWKYTLIMSAGYFFSSLSLWVMARRKTRLVKCGKREIVSHLKPSVVLFIPIIATSIFRLMDKIMIGNYCGMASVGYYENADKLIMISASVLGAIMTVIMPKITSLLAARDLNKMNKLFNISVDLCMSIAFAIAFGIASVAHEFIPIFFGDAFFESIWISILLCVSLPFMIWSMLVRNLYLIPHEMDEVYAKSVVYGAIIDLILNLILIPIIGVYGAVIGTIAAELFLATYQTYPVRHKINLSLHLKSMMQYFAIGIVMLIAVKAVGSLFGAMSIGALIVEMATGALLYIGLAAVIIKKSGRYGLALARSVFK